jgi:ubiquinone/menaquinone biosynthesis C-methylase UbiE
MVVDILHDTLVFGRRVRRLVELLAPLVEGSTLLDVGCGDGSISRLVGNARSGLQVRGIDVLVRPETKIPVAPFDGLNIPHPDRSFDTVMLVDVIHHAVDGRRLLAEAARVAARRVLIKDHDRNGLLAYSTLRFMDWVCNARHGVALPYNYWNREEWRQAFQSAQLTTEFSTESLRLYPWPASMVFDRGLHFIAASRPGFIAASRPAGG